MSNINIADVNPGDELTVKIGSPLHPGSWATLSGKVRGDSLGYLTLGEILVRGPDGGLLSRVREIVAHTPAKPVKPVKPDEPQNIGAAVEDS